MSTEGSGEREQRLNDAIAAYREENRTHGLAPDHDELVRQHPDLAEDLRSFLADHDRMRAIAALEVLPSSSADDDAPALPPGGAPVPAAVGVVRYFGDYELLEESARGGMGVVSKARQRSLNRVVALKMILAGQLVGEDDVQRYWDLNTMKEIRRLQRHRAEVSAVAFAADGRTAFSGSPDMTVRRWDTTTGRQLGICRGLGWVYSLAVSKDGFTVLSGGNDAVVQRWGWPRADGQ